MLNNKGFTLIEVLAVVIIISLVLFIVGREVGSTLSVTKNDSYEIMKNNIISVSKDYITECNNRIISCNLVWDNDKTSFSATKLRDSGYFKDFNSPIDGKDLSNCLVINAFVNNGVISIDLVDNCY